MKNWDKYFINIVKMVAEDNNSCLRQKVGCLLVRNDNTIISTGYNGAPKDIVSCGEKNECYRIKNNIISGTKQELCFAVHAEQNALIFAARHGLSTLNSKCYVTLQPCVICLKLLIQAGIKEIIYINKYNIEFEHYYDIAKNVILKQYK
ncbi:MAG TPA: dCMP deaminase family protein [Bacteroidales bacterium]|nr:dCMP deaminase family protein [Bacteroidales bacterium]